MKSHPSSGGPVAPDTLADLAAASRILAARGVVDGMGHVSLRHPAAPDRFLISRSMAPALVTPDDIVELDLNSEPCDPDAPGSFLERFIHGEIYRARPDVMSVVHSHSASVIPFGLSGPGMRAMYHNAAFLSCDVPVFDIREDFGTTDMLVCDCARGSSLAATLGERSVALMRAHGSVACGPTLRLAVFRAVYTEVNARIQHWTNALASGGDIAALSREEAELADVANTGAATRSWELWRAEVHDQTGW
ncbi:class II aldolase/adducin family protein [Roseibium marinum]|uniref:HCOMODA/2-hydroxy-3-carboxy-muconic semialdehyde decarboxylase n=1 Tax=Roseibium marinum TaxID=281252 RepID=A0A2S3V3K2_9HYPH|nr:class II aldolase/adducin family protein [Roseibium marinum]POF34531.1 HCOMODA/2-hydroxy-3-carboxy-muconic semialdehyde decarboxylase [Roseibium marinum]